MKYFIIIFLFFLFYFITIKDIYDSNKYLTEDVRLLELELGEKDSVVIKLQYINSKLNQKIKELTEVKKPKNLYVKPVVKKQDPVVEEISPVINDTTKQ